MDVPQIVSQVAPLVGLATQLVAAAFQGLQSLKRSNVEEFFRLLLADTPRRERGLKRIGQDENLQRLFFSIIDRVASEERKEKIRNWKNLLVHLATDFSGEEFQDTYTRILDYLSVLDLLVLHQAYAMTYEKGKIEEQVAESLSMKGIERPMIIQSIRRLAANGLLDERQKGAGVFGDITDDPIAMNLLYDTNEFGRKFLRVIADDENE